jgi:hypothetical protein
MVPRSLEYSWLKAVVYPTPHTFVSIEFLLVRTATDVSGMGHLSKQVRRWFAERGFSL